MNVTRKAVTGAIALTLVFSSSAVASSSARSPKPFQSETVTIRLGTGLPPITPAEFLATCDIPTATQGLDAYVFAVPRPYRSIVSTIRTKGEGVDITGTAEYHDIDIWIYNSQCNQIAKHITDSREERGYLPAGSAFILLSDYATPPMAVSGPAEVSFRLEPVN